MISDMFQMSLTEAGTSFIIGIALGLIFLYFLWQTVLLLPRIKHPTLFLFTSYVLRHLLLILGMIILSGEHAGRFIVMAFGVILTRFVILSFTKAKEIDKTEEKAFKKTLAHKKGRKNGK